ncbi:peptidylglycine alpha-hydroxylating monooxygenase-like [Haliotis asinina]|uniref:peptidylglycine alpha-hydroxylating monooxygenase-like n=1 Tax=Haliotis asinina TaxID=109174 RepID=UPI0035325F3A
MLSYSCLHVGLMVFIWGILYLPSDARGVKTLRVAYGNSLKEEHTCSALPLSEDNEEYIVTFDPKADPSRVLHLSVQVCDGIPGHELLWSCGNGVPGCIGNIRPVYVWGMNSTTWRLPPDTAIPVGGASGGRFIVLQAHIHNPHQTGKTMSSHPPYAEVKLHVSSRRPRFEVGLMILGNTGFIPPQQTRFVSESACPWNSVQSAFVLGYRLHTHRLGRWIEGFAVSEDGWKLIGEGKPLSPENVHRSFTKQLLRNGDFLASRCYYENLQSKPVKFGSEFHDEMCNFHLLYVFPYGAAPNLRFRTCAQDAQAFHLKDAFFAVPEVKNHFEQKSDTQYGY